MLKNLTPEQLTVVKKCTTGVAVFAIVGGIVMLWYQPQLDRASEGEIQGLDQVGGVVWADDVASRDPLSSPPTTSSVVVDIGGAVKRPGIYRLNQNSRLADLVELAGGFIESEVHRAYLLRDLNLAMVLQDSTKYYVPFTTDGVATLTSNFDQPTPSGNNQVGSLISINNASQASLDTLPGIGEARSKQIIDGRPYRELEELVTRKILGQITFDGLRDLIFL